MTIRTTACRDMGYLSTYPSNDSSGNGLKWNANNDILMPLEDKLCKYWRGDDFYDADLTNINGVTTGQGIYKGAFVFDSSKEQYLEIATDELDMGYSTDFTIAFWYKGATPALAKATYFGNGQTSWSSGSVFYRRQDDSSYNALKCCEASDHSYLEGASGFFDDTWRHTMLIRQGTSMYLYENNELKETDNENLNMNWSAYGKFSIGYSYIDTGSSYLDGTLCDLAIWKGHGMNATERAALYNSGTGTFRL